jgi:A/G-specific adenine glycosylase
VPQALNPGALLAWFEEHRRDLPWRATRDPWAVLVSEVMLQQTQAPRVIPKWHAFLERFPDPATCAAAPAGAVIEAWAGLGYNRRGLALHRCAQAVVAEHGGRLPDDLPGLVALPGIGPYTARAVLAFAHEQDVAVLDTHVARLVARQAGRRFTPKEAQAAADVLVPVGEGWAWNQAVLDLGAMVCRSRSPRCDACPVSSTCAWRGEGPDPAVGSAGVSTPQSRFEGSDRQGRGRLVDALRLGPVRDLATATGWPDDPDRAARVAATLVADGLAVRDGDRLRLP